MDRRRFIQTGAGALIGGWFGFRIKPTQARPEGVLAPSFKESAEVWDLGSQDPVFPVTVIRMSMPFESQGIVFQKGATGARFVVPRAWTSTTENLKKGLALKAGDPVINEMLRQRMAQVLAAWRKPIGHSSVFLIVPAPTPIPKPLSEYAVCLIMESHEGTDYRLSIASEDCFHKEHMRLTVPAAILFG